MTVYFDLSFQNQTINPSVGTYSSGDGVTPSFELVDNEYYLKNVGSHGYYHFNIANIPNDTVIEFDLVFNNKYSFNWIFLFESTNSNWWGIGTNYSDLLLGGYNLSGFTLASNITNGTKYHVTLISQYNTSGNAIKIYLNNNLVLTTVITTAYDRSQFLLLGNTVNYTSNCYIKDILITDLSANTTKYLNGTGLAEVWTNAKNYISAQLLGKSDVGHTHTKSEITDLPNGYVVDSTLDGTSSNAIANSAVSNALDGKANSTHSHALESLSTNSIPFHNAYPRCKYLGTSITDAQNTAIKNRTYDDLFIGDYWTINGVNWRIVAIDYYYNVGDTNFGKGNIIVMPDTVLYNAQMNATDTTAGAYHGSLMRTQNLNSARTVAQNAFGSHLANHRIILANAVDSSGPSDWSWYDSDGVELPNEVQIYGTRVWGSALKGLDVGTQKQQFPLMALAPQFVSIRQDYWLQDVSSLSVFGGFTLATAHGIADSSIASNSRGVRPSFTLSYI